MRIRILVCALVLVLPAAIAGCGGGGGGGGDSTNGQFVDSAVSGLSYEAGDRSGLTDGQGGFSFPPEGATVTFSVGDIVLPSAPARAVMTPVQLVAGAHDQFDETVTNIARFLQTIDDDGDPQNGIVITEAVRAAAEGLSIDFAQSASTFETDPEVLAAIAQLTAATQAGTRALVSTASAQEHLGKSLLATMAGHYQGTYAGGDSGTWTMDIDTQGNIVGESRSQNHDGVYSLEGTLTSSGDAGFASGDSSNGATFSGSFTLDGDVDGTWTSESGESSGTFEGGRNH